MNPKQIGIGLLVVAIVAVAVMQFNNTSNNTENGSDTTMQTSETTESSTAAGTNAATSDIADPSGAVAEESQYANGTYEATGNYTSPAQEEEVDIVITLADGVVVDAQFEGKATHETSKKLQGLFSEGFAEEVIGKNIDDINLTVVNGSSLTPKGFMDALQKVKEEASA